MLSYDGFRLVKTKWEYLVPMLTTFSLVISCLVISRKKYFWNDELLSFYLLDDQSFFHMMSALSDTINNAPPLYFVVGWVWAILFTSSELSLRLFSCLGICSAFAITWITLRRTYDFWPATIANLSVFGLSYIILPQIAEARFYGLLLLVCALGLMQYDTLCRTDSSSTSLMLTTCVIHAAVIQTHLFGFLYSGAILLALIVRDTYLAKRRPKIYLAVTLGWATFVPWISPFLNQADLARPRAWIPPPGIQDLIASVSLPPPFFFVLLALSGIILIINDRNLGVFSAALTQSLPSSLGKKHALRSEISLLILAYCFLAVPAIIWVVSLTLQPMFIGRYMIATQLSLSIILAAIMCRILIPPIHPSSERYPNGSQGYERALQWQGAILTTVFVLLLLCPIVYAAKYPAEPLPGSQDSTYGHEDLPVAMEFSHQFLRRFHYAPERLRYYFMLDWDAALNKDSGLFPPAEYKTMNALKRNYPDLFESNILQSRDFLERHKRFLVLDITGSLCNEIVCHRWFETRIEENSIYTIRQLGVVDGMNLMLVEAEE